MVALDRLLAEADFVSLHVPLMPSTRHLIDAAALRKMKRTAVLVNTARGPVVDERALAEALRDGVIAAAGIDAAEKARMLAAGIPQAREAVAAYMRSPRGTTPFSTRSKKP